jgi:hypothetical protein
MMLKEYTIEGVILIIAKSREILALQTKLSPAFPAFLVGSDFLSPRDLLLLGKIPIRRPVLSGSSEYYIWYNFSSSFRIFILIR